MCQMVIFALAYTVSEKLNELVTFSNQQILHRKPSGFLASQGVAWAHIPVRHQSTVPGTRTFLPPVDGVGPFTTPASTTPSRAVRLDSLTWSAGPCRHLRCYRPWRKWSWHRCDCLACLGTTVASPELEPAASQRDSLDPEEIGPSQGEPRAHQFPDSSQLSHPGAVYYLFQALVLRPHYLNFSGDLVQVKKPTKPEN